MPLKGEAGEQTDYIRGKGKPRWTKFSLFRAVPGQSSPVRGT